MSLIPCLRLTVSLLVGYHFHKELIVDLSHSRWSVERLICTIFARTDITIQTHWGCCRHPGRNIRNDLPRVASLILHHLPSLLYLFCSYLESVELWIIRWCSHIAKSYCSFLSLFILSRCIHLLVFLVAVEINFISRPIFWTLEACFIFSMHCLLYKFWKFIRFHSGMLG